MIDTVYRLSLAFSFPQQQGEGAAFYRRYGQLCEDITTAAKVVYAGGADSTRIEHRAGDHSRCRVIVESAQLTPLADLQVELQGIITDGGGVLLDETIRRDNAERPQDLREVLNRDQDAAAAACPWCGCNTVKLLVEELRGLVLGSEQCQACGSKGPGEFRQQDEAEPHWHARCRSSWNNQRRTAADALGRHGEDRQPQV